LADQGTVKMFWLWRIWCKIRLENSQYRSVEYGTDDVYQLD
jgi:hypothetical protein